MKEIFFSWVFSSGCGLKTRKGDNRGLRILGNPGVGKQGKRKEGAELHESYSTAETDE